MSAASRTTARDCPRGLRRLIELAEAVPEKEGARAAAKRTPLLERVGDWVLAYSVGMADFLGFFGDLSVALAKFVRGKARYRTIDLMEVVQQCGPDAVGIVSLIAFSGRRHPGLHGRRATCRSSARQSMSPTWWESGWCATWAR